MSKKEPPGRGDLSDLQWLDTRSWGVYASLLLTDDEDRQDFVYTGSEAGVKGLESRKDGHYHANVMNGRYDDNFYLRIMRENRTSEFITLMMIPVVIRRMDRNEIAAVSALWSCRLICLFAEGIYTTWLGAYLFEKSQLPAVHYPLKKVLFYIEFVT